MQGDNINIYPLIYKYRIKTNQPNKNYTMNFITYEELRILAIKEDIPDNKVSIGIYAKMNGYYQIKRQIDKKTKILYYKL